MLRAVSSAAAAPDAKIAELRRRIGALERAGGSAGKSAGAGRALPFGVPEIDAALPWHGLALGALHEISGPARDGAALGFVSALLARLAGHGAGQGGAPRVVLSKNGVDPGQTTDRTGHGADGEFLVQKQHGKGHTEHG